MSRAATLALVIAAAIGLTASAAAAPALAPAAPAPAPAPAQDDRRPAWRQEVATLLDARARAVRQGDERAFLATMTAAPAAFRARTRTWFRRMQDLPVDRYALEPALHTWEDLAPALDDPPDAEEVHVIEATERIGFAGYDADASHESVYLTVVRRDGRWSIVSDTDLEDLGLLSARHPWDLAPVQVLERDGVLVVFHDDAADARRILDATIDAVGRIRRAWPLSWRRRVVVMIPRSAADLARIFATTVDLSPFVAFAGSSQVRDREGGFALAGSRIYVQPDTFFGYSSSFQAETLGHEMLHYATRPLAGAFTPSWLEEGVAQVFGERSARAVPDLMRDARRIDGLPDDHEFFIGANIHRSYQASVHFAGWLRDRHGGEAVARFYRAIGARTPVAFGTGRYHLDRAARQIFETRFEALERAWLERLREEAS